MSTPKQSYPLITTDELIMNSIYLFREQKVMLDVELARLYHVETKQLKRQVKRNIERFPEDFMFELNTAELEILRSQSGTSSWGGTRYMPMAFTEQGVAMLSRVLNSPTAIRVNIQIIRVFTKMRTLLMTNKDILLQLEKLNESLLSMMKISPLFFNTSKNCSPLLRLHPAKELDSGKSKLSNSGHFSAIPLKCNYQNTNIKPMEVILITNFLVMAQKEV